MSETDSPRKPPPAAARRLRRLSEEEIELWLTVAAHVVPRAGSTLPERVTASPAVAETPALAVSAAAVPVASTPAPTAKAALPPLAPLERKLKQKLSRGRTTADAAIDLHGLRQDEALSALRRFLLAAQRDGLKVVLVVTGKGGRSTSGLGFGEDTIGVLRRAVPLWLAMPEFRALIVGYEEAARTHGGSGALYVRLRRR